MLDSLLVLFSEVHFLDSKLNGASVLIEHVVFVSESPEPLLLMSLAIIALRYDLNHLLEVGLHKFVSWNEYCQSANQDEHSSLILGDHLA